ncbi:hypothetical protein E0L93_00575 [Rubrobacter taiwanensis]|jgi:hypothetical protein|uniref:Uncharacterized protein n=1 Tax=Rubrobacter taiwanensis TaxID=185139 RepID=A0A4R1BSY2_9ACTN|nr:hypothetical protein [Rubrobacter taiwanensis]TCJ20758.1 hypothetical protein E0L93_00575 [Rubrobacter taiwanensis]
MRREIVERALGEAREQEANLVIWDRRDTFVIEPGFEVSLEDEYLRVEMEDGKAVVYVEYGHIYKLVVEREKGGRKSGPRAGFGVRVEG